MEVLISIVIPCYNHGAYLQEALDSIENVKITPVYEIIIVNDGSTCELTLEKLAQLQQDGYTIINQVNQGLAAARNNGISIAKGKYIIPLDSDNKLHINYLTTAIDILEKDGSIDVVYGNPLFFGDEEGLRKIGGFDFPKLLVGNFIDACAVYKKDIWMKVGGYDGKMPAMGHEDWEFWMNIYLNGGHFFYLDELCFFYRSLPDSMAKTVSTPNGSVNRDYILSKHHQKIINVLLDERNNLKSKLAHSSYYLKKHRIKAIVKILIGFKI